MLSKLRDHSAHDDNMSIIMPSWRVRDGKGDTQGHPTARALEVARVHEAVKLPNHADHVIHFCHAELDPFTLTRRSALRTSDLRTSEGRRCHERGRGAQRAQSHRTDFHLHVQVGEDYLFDLTVGYVG